VLRCSLKKKLVLQISPAVAAIVFLLAACSEIGYPAVHDMPGPRADTPLTPDQVKEATDSLISERDHLSTEVQGHGPANQATNAPAGTGFAGPQKPSASAQPSATRANAYAPAQIPDANNKQ
jgi:hypothetical protein